MVRPSRISPETSVTKAKRGELRRGLPVGFVWGEADGEVLFHPDQAVTGAIRTVFEKFAEMGSVRQVWLWFRSEGLLFPLQSNGHAEIQWVTASYTAIRHGSVTLPAGSGCPIRAATVRERTSRSRVMGVSALNRRFRYVERGPADSVTDPSITC